MRRMALFRDQSNKSESIMALSFFYIIFLNKNCRKNTGMKKNHTKKIYTSKINFKLIFAMRKSSSKKVKRKKIYLNEKKEEKKFQ